MTGTIMTKQQILLFDLFKTLAIETQTYYHEPVFTVEQARAVSACLPAAQCKNLFLKDAKQAVYLLVALSMTEINLKKFAKAVHSAHLSFANAQILSDYLGVLPGSVSPFALINDTSHSVTVILDCYLFDHQKLGFHPLENNATTIITPQDLQKFINYCSNNYSIFDFYTHQTIAVPAIITGGSINEQS